MGIEPTSSAWKADILADVLYPQLQKALYHNFPQMSSMNLAAAKVRKNKEASATMIRSPTGHLVLGCLSARKGPLQMLFYVATWHIAAQHFQLVGLTGGGGSGRCLMRSCLRSLPSA